MIHVDRKEKYDFNDLYDIIRKLRSPEGCPWDRVQTHDSLRKPMIEEAYEAVDAIEKESVEKMKEELGDVLLQVIFHTIIGEENGELTFEDVTDRCARKMLSRHTHIFGNEHAENPEEALNNWEAAKLKEKGFSSLQEDLNDIPNGFPALLRAAKAAKKVRKAGEREEDISAFETDASNTPEIDYSSSEEVGRLLFEIARLAEQNGVEPELALKDYTNRMINHEN